MSNTVNYGIDLGTTNSVIAKHESSEVTIYKNPIGLKDTLPSAVSFRNGRTIVGDKARDFIIKDPSNTFFAFKRKMGTTETFYIPSLDKEITPIELSSMVLKELKTFETSEEVNNAIITIPASFDTIQSNATKEAGLLAGFDEVFLLQEPIAASLAYVNKGDLNISKDGKWLVYDLGGGTFDVAIIKVENGEMSVIDHKGNNFLGGVDIDILFIEKLIIPKLKAMGNFEEIEIDLKKKTGKFNNLFFRLMKIAEEAKIELTTKESVFVEFETLDLDNKEVDFYCPIERLEFESILDDILKQTIDLTYEVINTNELGLRDINQILLVGGCTYLPKLRSVLSHEFGIRINTSIDPTNSVAVGAAYYAASVKASTPAKKTSSAPPEAEEKSRFNFTSSYHKSSKDREEYFAVKVTGEIKKGYQYRITRSDGGYDSGLKELEKICSEYLLLSPNALNTFDFKVFNKNGKTIHYENIEIAQGNYNIYGQPLPDDICLEIDDQEKKATKLELIFSKNSILPLKKTITKSVSRTIKKNSEDNLIINIIEGSSDTIPSACKGIGFIEIKGKELTRDLIKRADVEISLEITESRDVKVSAYVSMLDQEFSEIFNSTSRFVNIQFLKEEVEELRQLVSNAISFSRESDQMLVVENLEEVSDKIDSLYFRTLTLSDDDVTDEKYRIEDEKRKYARAIHNLTKGKELVYAQLEYIEARDYCKIAVNNNGSPVHKEEYEALLAMEKSILASGSKVRIQKLKERFNELERNIVKTTPEYAISLFHYYSNSESYEPKNKERADRYINIGNNAIEKGNYVELMSVVYSLHSLYPEEMKRETKNESFSGKMGII